MQVVLPYMKAEKKDAIFSPEKIEPILNECVLLSATQPCYLEIRGDIIQWYLFFRERQLYAAGKIENGQFAGTTIKDFLLGCAVLNSATFSCYMVNNKILHSILILFQKKPSIKIATSLVDLDKLLDKIEEEGKSCIISASQDDFLAILRYEKGVVTALCSEHSFPYPKEEAFRDDFLVKIYTLSAEKQLQIYLYEDLLVHFASDAKLVEASFAGNFADLFLSKPPTVVLYLKGKELSRFSLDKSVTNIGRTREKRYRNRQSGGLQTARNNRRKTKAPIS